MTTTAPLAAVPPELGHELAAVLMRHGYEMPATAKDVTHVLQRAVRYQRAVAELVNAYADIPPFEGAVAAPVDQPGGPGVRLVHEFTLDDLIAGVAGGAAGRMTLVRFQLGDRERHVPHEAVRWAAWLALDSDAIEVAGRGWAAEQFTAQLRREIDVQRREIAEKTERTRTAR